MSQKQSNAPRISVKEPTRDVNVDGTWKRYGLFVSVMGTDKPKLSIWRLVTSGARKVKLNGKIKPELISGKFYVKK